jgi:hypothetical protein
MRMRLKEGSTNQRRQKKNARRGFDPIGQEESVRKGHFAEGARVRKRL